MNSYPQPEAALLLSIARQTLIAITNGDDFAVDLDTLPPALQEKRACFITLFTHPDKQLRGCTGTLIARQQLALEVIHTTQQTAFNDPRFYPVKAEEVPHLRLEISVLTPPQPLPHQDAADLLTKLRPGIDGVTLRYKDHLATLLPQVWERLPDPADFLSALCDKMRLHPDLWRTQPMEVFTYTAIEIHETE